MPVCGKLVRRSLASLLGRRERNQYAISSILCEKTLDFGSETSKLVRGLVGFPRICTFPPSTQGPSRGMEIPSYSAIVHSVQSVPESFPLRVYFIAFARFPGASPQTNCTVRAFRHACQLSESVIPSLPKCGSPNCGTGPKILGITMRKRQCESTLKTLVRYQSNP